MVGVVHAHAEVGLRPLHDFHGSGRCEHRTDIDCHVEEGEGGVATVSILRVVVQVAYHHLQVAFEETRAHANQHQRGKHHHHRQYDSAVVHAAERECQQHIAQEHHDDTNGNALAVTNLIGKDTAHERQEIH